MRILVDATTWVPGRTGIGLYTERLLRALRTHAPDDELILASNLPLTDVDIDVTRAGPKMPIRAAWMQTAMPVHGLIKRPDVAFYPNYMAPLLPTCPTVVTVHDMAVFLYPETFTWKKRVLQRALLPAILKRVDAIVTPSHASRRDLLKLIDLDPRRVVPIHLAADPRLAQPLDDTTASRIAAELDLPERYLLAVSTLEPRKNLVRLIEAFETVGQRDKDVQLVLVGGKGWRDDGIRRAIQKSSMADRIVTTGYVTFDALRVVYRNAIALCYPSLYEGFGLPVVEAMACGCPVLTSRGSSLDEVADDAALVVEATAIDQIIDGMTNLVQSATLRDELREKGHARAARLSWDRTAKHTREVFACVADGRLPTTSQQQ